MREGIENVKKNPKLAIPCQAARSTIGPPPPSALPSSNRILSKPIIAHPPPRPTPTSPRTTTSYQQSLPMLFHRCPPPQVLPRSLVLYHRTPRRVLTGSKPNPPSSTHLPTYQTDAHEPQNHHLFSTIPPHGLPPSSPSPSPTSSIVFHRWPLPQALTPPWSSIVGPLSKPHLIRWSSTTIHLAKL